MTIANYLTGRSRNAVALLGVAVLFLLAMHHTSGTKTVVTATGIVGSLGDDLIHVFGKKRNLNGEPFTVVFTFEDGKGTPAVVTRCQGTATGVSGGGANSPGTAVLTIEGKSYAFGGRKISHSATWREIASSCSDSHIVFNVDDDPWNDNIGISINIHPARGSFTQNPDWRAPLTISAANQDSMSGFVIAQNAAYGSKGVFWVRSVTIKRE